MSGGLTGRCKRTDVIILWHDVIIGLIGIRTVAVAAKAGKNGRRKY